MRESLRVLRLTGCRASGLLALAQEGCPQLTALDIRLSPDGHNGQLSSALDALLDVENFPRLTSLTVRCYGEKRLDLIRHLISNPAISRLREIGFAMTLQPEEFQMLTRVTTLDSLDRLSIPGHFLTEAFGTTSDKILRTTEERKKAVAVLQERFGPRYDPSW